MNRLLLVTLGLALSASLASAKVSLAPLFCDGAVLQRDTAVSVWGRGEPGEKVEVRFAEKTTAGTVDAQGRWLLLLPAMPASSQSRDLVVTGEFGGVQSSITVHDVLVGDVWLCAGQSNIEWPVRLSNGGAEAAAKADFPTLRHLKIPRTNTAAPREDVQVEWKMATPENTPHFTGVGFFFARRLQAKLQVPIGLINCTYGGTSIECWFDPVSLGATDAGRATQRAWDKSVADWIKTSAAHESAIASGAKTGQIPSKPVPPSEWQVPSGAYNGMLYSTIPYTLKGVVWYQGESNVGRHQEYRELFPAMIRLWRQRWGAPDLPFVYAQLPVYRDPNDGSDKAWAEFRGAQGSALELKNTAMAITLDAGDADNLHPTDKQTVGERLAVAAGNLVFGWEGEWTGPTPVSARGDGDTLVLSFSHAEGGLVLKDFMVSGFELADADGVYYPAAAKVEGSTLRLTAGHVVAPKKARYAWRNAPVPTLYNKDGFPAGPFETEVR